MGIFLSENIPQSPRKAIKDLLFQEAALMGPSWPGRVSLKQSEATTTLEPVFSATVPLGATRIQLSEDEFEMPKMSFFYFSRNSFTA